MKREKEKIKKKATHKRNISSAKTVQIFAVLLISIALLALFPTLTSAAPETVAERNRRLCEEAIDELGDAIEAYSASDTSSNKEISQKTSVAIISYRKEILDMQSDALFSEMSFESKIALSKAKGLATGHITWAFRSRIYEYSTLARDEKFSSEFEKYSSEIASATLPSTIEANLHKYIAGINKIAFCQLINNESKVGDSLSVNAIIEGSIDEINKLYSTEISGNEYRKIYLSALEKISLQRTKDKLTDQLLAVYSIIKPHESFSTDKHVALFVYQLEEKTELDIEDMNNVLNNTISSILDTLSVGSYTKQFIDKTKENISQLTEAASKVGITPSLAGEFSEFEFEYACVHSKDKISSTLLKHDGKDTEELLQIEEEYNRDGGIIDLCSSLEELDFEVKRAKLRGDWFIESQNACEEIKKILSPHSPDASLAQIKAIYSKCDTQIILVSFSTKNAEILTNAEFAKGVEALADAKNEAKIQKYKNDHSAIIAKQTSEIKSKDRSALDAAIKDAIALDSALLDKITALTSTLAAKYKIALKAELSERQIVSSAAHIWKNALTTLHKEIDDIAEALSISEFYSTAARISDRAGAIESIIKKFSETAESEEYKSFSDTSKTAFIKSCADAVDIVLAVNITPISWSQRLSEAIDGGELILLKGYAAESLRTMASTAKSSDAAPLAEEAAADITKALTKEKVDEIYNDAKFKLSRILYYERSISRADSLKKEISALEYLTEQRKNEFKKQITDNIDTVSEKIKLSSTPSYLEIAKNEADAFLTSIESEAKGENLKAAKRLAEGNLATTNVEFGKTISGLTYASNNEKQSLQKDMARLNAELLAKIDSAKSVEELVKISEDMKKSFEDFSSQIHLTELDACKRNAKDRYDEFLSSKELYSVDNYNSIKSIINESAEKLNKFNAISDILGEQKNTLEKLNAFPTLLESEKQRAQNTLNTLFSSIESKKTLYSGNRFDTIKQLYKSATDSINAITDPQSHQKIEPILSRAITDMTTIPQDRVQTADSLILSAIGNAKYPLGYSISEDGYPAFITAEGKIPYNSHLKLTSLSTSEKHSVLRKLLRKDKVLTTGGATLSPELSKALKKSAFLLGFNLESSLEFDGTEYKLTILLPNGTDIQKIIGVIGFDSNNSAEFYKFSVDGSLLTIITDTAGEFFIATEKNNLPIILALILILLLLVPLGYFAVKYMRDSELPPFAPRRNQVPDEDLPKTSTSLQPVSSSREVCPKDRPQPPTSAAESSEEQSNQAEANKKQGEVEPSPDEKIAIDDELLFGTLVDDYDTTVKEEQKNKTEDKQEPEKEKKRFADSFMSAKLRRAEINLDVIAKNFKAGDTVTLDAMIKKGLLPAETTFVKVLARGKITKPLTIIAQDFSTAAMKTILLAGGNATITEEKIISEDGSI